VVENAQIYGDVLLVKKLKNTITMFENIRKKISNIKSPADVKSEIESEIIEIGDIGVRNALELNRAPTEMAIDRLDSIRLSGEEKNMTFASILASRQIDRIMEAKSEW